MKINNENEKNNESLEEDKLIAAMYGEDIIRAETDRSNAIEINDVAELFDRLEEGTWLYEEYRFWVTEWDFF